ncbi:MAG: DEAD/DEAH box helicase [Chitinophagales bacterium]
MTFSDLNLNKFLLRAVNELGFEVPTAIQRKVFSPVMAGNDVIGIAQTGTGKTFAYLLPVLSLWKYSKSGMPQILIIVPTRELVAQVVEEIEKLTVYMNVRTVGVFGGTNIKTQKALVQEGLDVIVGTPGRLMDLMLDGVLKTKSINRLIIDEVDEMLNLGFRTQLKNILDLLPAKRQNLMFSATMTDEVEQVIKIMTSYFEKIEAAPSGAPLENIEQMAYELPNFISKANMLQWLLTEHTEMDKVLVFVSTKKKADALYERMSIDFEEQVGVIHSSKSQNNRFDAVNAFQSGDYRMLIATDIIARGLDIESVSHVINFDLPDVAEKYIHRIGRTGRAKEKGIAIAFISEEEDLYKLMIEELMDQPIPILPLPENVELSEELIDLEIPNEHVPFDNHKTKKVEPSGPAFHEKKAKNKKVNKKIRRKEQMKLKYKKPKTRGQKNFRKKGK